MDQYYVFTTSGRVFYTSISLSDRFKQYQVFNAIRCSRDYCEYFGNRAHPESHGYGISPCLNRFAKAPLIWDSNFQTFFGESSWVGADHNEPEIYKPVPNTKRNKKKRRKKTKRAAKKALTKEQLDEELDRYMMDVK